MDSAPPPHRQALEALGEDLAAIHVSSQSKSSHKAAEEFIKLLLEVTQLSQPNPTTSLLTTFQRLDGVAKEAITYLLKHCPLNTVKVLAALYKRTWFTIIPALWRFKQNVSSQDEQTLHDELKIVVLRINFVSTGLVVDVLKGMDVKKRKGPPETAQQAKLREDCFDDFCPSVFATICDVLTKSSDVFLDWLDRSQAHIFVDVLFVLSRPSDGRMHARKLVTPTVLGTIWTRATTYGYSDDVLTISRNLRPPSGQPDSDAKITQHWRDFFAPFVSGAVAGRSSSASTGDSLASEQTRRRQEVVDKLIPRWKVAPKILDALVQDTIRLVGKLDYTKPQVLISSGITLRRADRHEPLFTGPPDENPRSTDSSIILDDNGLEFGFYEFDDTVEPGAEAEYLKATGGLESIASALFKVHSVGHGVIILSLAESEESAEPALTGHRPNNKPYDLGEDLVGLEVLCTANNVDHFRAALAERGVCIVEDKATQASTELSSRMQGPYGLVKGSNSGDDDEDEEEVFGVVPERSSSRVQGEAEGEDDEPVTPAATPREDRGSSQPPAAPIEPIAASKAGAAAKAKQGRTLLPQPHGGSSVQTNQQPAVAAQPSRKASQGPSDSHAPRASPGGSSTRFNSKSASPAAQAQPQHADGGDAQPAMPPPAPPSTKSKKAPKASTQAAAAIAKTASAKKKNQTQAADVEDHDVDDDEGPSTRATRRQPSRGTKSKQLKSKSKRDEEKEDSHGEDGDDEDDERDNSTRKGKAQPAATGKGTRKKAIQDDQVDASSSAAAVPGPSAGVAAKKVTGPSSKKSVTAPWLLPSHAQSIAQRQQDDAAEDDAEQPHRGRKVLVEESASGEKHTDQDDQSSKPRAPEESAKVSASQKGTHEEGDEGIDFGMQQNVENEDDGRQEDDEERKGEKQKPSPPSPSQAALERRQQAAAAISGDEVAASPGARKRAGPQQEEGSSDAASQASKKTRRDVGGEPGTATSSAMAPSPPAVPSGRSKKPRITTTGMMDEETAKSNDAGPSTSAAADADAPAAADEAPSPPVEQQALPVAKAARAQADAGQQLPATIDGDSVTMQLTKKEAATLRRARQSRAQKKDGAQHGGGGAAAAGAAVGAATSPQGAKRRQQQGVDDEEHGFEDQEEVQEPDEQPQPPQRDAAASAAAQASPANAPPANRKRKDVDQGQGASQKRQRVRDKSRSVSPRKAAAAAAATSQPSYDGHGDGADMGEATGDEADSAQAVWSASRKGFSMAKSVMKDGGYDAAASDDEDDAELPIMRRCKRAEASRKVAEEMSSLMHMYHRLAAKQDRMSFERRVQAVDERHENNMTECQDGMDHLQSYIAGLQGRINDMLSWHRRVHAKVPGA